MALPPWRDPGESASPHGRTSELADPRRETPRILRVHGKIIRKPYKNHGNRGKTMGKSWENHGKTMDKGDEHEIWRVQELEKLGFLGPIYELQVVGKLDSLLPLVSHD